MCFSLLIYLLAYIYLNIYCGVRVYSDFWEVCQSTTCTCLYGLINICSELVANLQWAKISYEFTAHYIRLVQESNVTLNTGHSVKHLLLLFMIKTKSNRFKITWWWVNDDQKLHFCMICPFHFWPPLYPPLIKMYLKSMINVSNVITVILIQKQ